MFKGGVTMDWEERKEIVNIAIYYYYKEMTQDQIAKKLNISRPVVSRSLQKAKEMGIINFYIKDESFPIVKMQSDLEDKFNLKKAIIAPSYHLTETEIFYSVVQHAIQYLRNELKKVHNVGISWGNTLSTLASQFPYEKNEHLTLVPLIGGMSNTHIEIHSNQICYDLMKKFQCKSNFLYAPALAQTSMIREIFYQNDILEAGRNVDMAILGISNPYGVNRLMRKIGYTTNQDIKEFESLGVVGDINSRFFNQDGVEVDCRINRHVIGINLNEIKNIPHVVLIASGMEKKEAVFSAVKAGYAHTLIIDEGVAQYLLNQ